MLYKVRYVLYNVRYARFEVFTAVTMKMLLLLDIDS
jgi:hypothetical protein